MNPSALNKKVNALIILVLFLFIALVLFSTTDKFKVAEKTVYIQSAQKGDSAYQVWLDAGNHGTATDFLASLKGESATSTSSVAYAPVIHNGLDGKNGQDGKDGSSLELRKNPETGNVEVRTGGDFTWTVLLTKCDYTDCEAENGTN